MKAGKQQIGTLIDSVLYRRAKSLAVLQDRRVGDVIEDALREHLAKKTGKEETGHVQSRFEI